MTVGLFSIGNRILPPFGAAFTANPTLIANVRSTNLVGATFTANPTMTANATTGSGLQINIIYDASVASAPTGWTDAMQTAASLLMAAAPQTNCTVNVKVGYGIQPDSGPDAIVSGGSSEGGPSGNGGFIDYTVFRAAMVANDKSAAMHTLISSLPSGSTFGAGGPTSVWVNGGCQKALGMLANNSIVDGVAGFGPGVPSAVLVGVAIHEISHAIGRAPGNFPFNTFRYSSAGIYLTNDVPPAPASYFSLDGGITKLADFDTSSDPGDFLNGNDGIGVQDAGLGGNWDPFDAFYAGNTVQTITVIGKQLMECLGFQ